MINVNDLIGKIVHADCMDILRELPDNCVDLVLTNPPYFRVASEKWDRRWDSITEFQAWVERVAVQLRRVLAPHGALYWFCDDKNGAYVQVALDKYFYLLNNLVWQKPSLPCAKNEATGLRSYSISTERILFYEQAGASSTSATGLERIHSDTDCFRSLKDYLIRERASMMEARGWSSADFSAWVASVTGARSVHRHWFCDSQWELPTAEKYRALQSGGFFRREYEELRREYEELRRPWNNSIGAREVLSFPQDPSPHIHPTQKPVPLLVYLLERSTRPGFTVLDPFSGSGTTAVACYQMGLNFIGIEKDSAYHAASLERLRDEKKQTRLDFSNIIPPAEQLKLFDRHGN